MGLNELIKVGDKIKKLRKEKGISQKQAASQLNIPYSTYSNYENNNRTPDIETLCIIAEYLDVKVNVLLGTPDSNEHDIYFDFLSVFTHWIIEKGYHFDFSHDGTLFVENGGYQSIYLTKNGKSYVFSPQELKSYYEYLKRYFDVMLMEKENNNDTIEYDSRSWMEEFIKLNQLETSLEDNDISQEHIDIDVTE